MIKEQRYKVTAIGIGLFFIVHLNGCNYRLDKSALSPVSDNELSFALVSNSVFTPRCIACHGDGHKLLLKTYQDVKNGIIDIERVAIKVKSMPPRDPLSNNESTLLERWITAGAPENPLAPETEEPLNPTYDSIKKKILTPKCIACHLPGQSASRVPLQTKEDLLNSPMDLVLPGNPDESALILSITRKDEKKMPPRPSSPLSNEEVSAIRKWILDGAL